MADENPCSISVSTQTDTAIVIVNDDTNTDGDDNINNNNTDEQDINDETISTTISTKKQRFSASGTKIEVGATDVDGQAPQLNRRFFLGLDRPSRRRLREENRRRRRQERENAGSDNVAVNDTQQEPPEARRSSVRRTSLVQSVAAIFTPYTGSLVEATLVEDNEEVYEAQPISYWQQRWKRFVLILGLGLVLLAVILAAIMIDNEKQKDAFIDAMSDSAPSMYPSSAPSYNQAPTLEQVIERGYLQCGVGKQAYADVIALNGTLNSTLEIENRQSRFALNLCAAIASVIFGGTDSFSDIVKLVETSGTDRFPKLQDRSADVLMSRVSHTLEREIRERTTGMGYSFSSPYFYDGVSYLGNKTLVNCAEKRKRYDECENLVICVSDGTNGFDYVSSFFPSDFIVTVYSKDEKEEAFLNGTCNVMSSDRLILYATLQEDGFKDKNYTVGDKLKTKEPLSVATRKDDKEWSDVVNWVIQALFFGEEQGITKSATLCDVVSPDMLIDAASELNYLNAVYCVGNYEQVLGSPKQDRGLNNINNGTAGMLYAIPFGVLDSEDTELTMNDDETCLLCSIRDQGILNCGVVVPVNFTQDVLESKELIGMNVEYCRTLSAALFNGNEDAVEIYTYTEDDGSAYRALNNGTVDVIAGAQIKKVYDFNSPLSSEPSGFSFSTPYYYGDERAGDDVKFYSMATRGDDNSTLFSSFVNAVVISTIEAQEELDRGQPVSMPLTPIFGSEFSWSLRDAIEYSGPYDNIYKKNFGIVSDDERGRNKIGVSIKNIAGGAQIHSFPGLSPTSK